MENKNYNFSLFKPVNDYGRKNRNIIISMLLIWFIAIFGFQLLLKIIEQPTPEKSLLTFESVWDKIKSGSANENEKQDFVKSLVTVSGKLTLKADKKTILKNAISWTCYSLLDEAGQGIISKQIDKFSSLKEKLATANDKDYVQLKFDIEQTQNSIISSISPKLGIETSSLEASIIPHFLNNNGKELSAEDTENLPLLMKQYCIHNQSFLTNFKFLGFPFHYFYTAEFLLFLFVFLCLIYHLRIEKLQKRFGIIEN